MNVISNCQSTKSHDDSGLSTDLEKFLLYRDRDLLIISTDFMFFYNETTPDSATGREDHR